jgi:hypothetical protein
MIRSPVRQTYISFDKHGIAHGRVIRRRANV